MSTMSDAKPKAIATPFELFENKPGMGPAMVARTPILYEEVRPVCWAFNVHFSKEGRMFSVWKRYI